jgi:hypothetical protein
MDPSNTSATPIGDRKTVQLFRSGAIASFFGPFDHEKAGKLIASLAVMLYVLGLVAVNGYLLQLGVADFALVRVRFIYTGFLIVLFVILSYPVPLSIFQSFTAQANRRATALQSPRQTSMRVWPRYVVFLLFTLLGTSFLFAGIFSVGSGNFLNLTPRIFDHDHLEGIKVLLVGFVYGAIMHGLLVLVRSAPEPPESQESRYSPALVVPLLGLAMFTVLYILFFMGYVFPKLPEQIGGGHPIAVRILFKDDAIDGVRELGVPIPSGGKLSEQVNLVYEGSEGYVLRLEKGKVVLVRKDLVAGTVTRSAVANEPR